VLRHTLTHFLLAHMFFASICPCLADLNTVTVVTFWTCYGQMVNILLRVKSLQKILYHTSIHVT